MDHNKRLHRATRVFLAALLISFGTAAPQVLREMADELEELESEAIADTTAAQPGGDGFVAN